jgi:expansin (peptidoglycan-binding protein)
MEGGYNTLLNAQPFKDKISIEWHIISCRFSAPLAIQNAPGASPHWFSMQIQNSNYPVSHMEVSADHGITWESTVSKDYNFFEGASRAGFGTDTVDLRIWCFNGRVVNMKDVSVSKDKKVWATSNC